jgi:calpain-15
LAEFPSIIANTFLTKEANEPGVYALRLCIAGIWRTVLVDDLFPCFPKSGPVFTKNNGNELWALLLEKAYAKCYRRYSALEQGRAAHAFEDLTGFPCDHVQFNDKEVISRYELGLN